MSRVLGEEALEEVLEGHAHVLGPPHWVLDDEADQLEDAVGVEGRLTGEELVQDAT